MTQVQRSVLSCQRFDLSFQADWPIDDSIPADLERLLVGVDDYPFNEDDDEEEFAGGGGKDRDG